MKAKFNSPRLEIIQSFDAAATFQQSLVDTHIVLLRDFCFPPAVLLFMLNNTQRVDTREQDRTLVKKMHRPELTVHHSYR